jgi:2-methylcitrate dehydratase PrpD
MNGGKAEPSTLETLADFACRTRFEELPNEVVTEVKRLLLDSIGCALGGHSVDKGKWGREYAAKFFSGLPQATVFGDQRRSSVLGAAFANGELINALDYDAILPPGHVSPFVVPSIWATAETRRSSGRRVIAACAVAHEIGHRLGKALANYRNIVDGKVVWPLVAGYSCCVFGGTAGLSMIEGFETEKTARALGLAAHLAPTQGHASWKNHLPLSTTKYLLAGWISQAEITAAALADLGHLGDVHAMEGDYGFWRHAGAQKWDAAVVRDRLSKTWLFPPAVAYKPYPACRTMHGGYDCLAAIVERENLHPREITAIRAWMESNVGEPLWQSLKSVDTHVDVQFNVAFTLSIVAHRIKPGPGWQSAKTMTDPGILKLMDVITYGIHPDDVKNLKEDPRTRTCKVEVDARGRTYTHEQRYIKGAPSPESWTFMTNEELAAKFRGNAEGVLPASKTDAAIDALLNLEKVDDIAALGDLLTP